jgi:hypothetical protein
MVQMENAFMILSKEAERKCRLVGDLEDFDFLPGEIVRPREKSPAGQSGVVDVTLSKTAGETDRVGVAMAVNADVPKARTRRGITNDYLLFVFRLRKSDSDPL